MNKYGSLAMNHWKSYQPERYSMVEDPTRFFTALGEQIWNQIEEIWDAQIRQSREELNSLDDLSRAGRMNAMRMTAEEVVLTETVYQNPDDPGESTQPETELSREDWLQSLGLVEDGPIGSVMPLDRTHPLWALWERVIQDEATPEQDQDWESAYQIWLDTLPELSVGGPGGGTDVTYDLRKIEADTSVTALSVAPEERLVGGASYDPMPSEQQCSVG